MKDKMERDASSRKIFIQFAALIESGIANPVSYMASFAPSSYDHFEALFSSDSIGLPLSRVNSVRFTFSTTATQRRHLPTHPRRGMRPACPVLPPRRVPDPTAIFRRGGSPDPTGISLAVLPLKRTAVRHYQNILKKKKPGVSARLSQLSVMVCRD
jgi:hypothetical protein